MQNRDIKWAPFNSVINGDKTLKELSNKKNIISKPVLSEDQIEYLNEKVLEAYSNHLKIFLYIYKDFKIIKLIGFINNINNIKKTITFNNTYIYFNQILRIENFF